MRWSVILAGGSGTRLWPASRQGRPKQFLALADGRSLLAATAGRLRTITDRLVIVTAAAQGAACATEVPTATIIGEPVPRNTAAALGLAAVHLIHDDAAAVLGAFPADHHIADEAGFAVVAERAFAAASKADVICTIGITPTHAETGFGYLELGAPRDDLGEHVQRVARFVEKPDAATAARYLAEGRHLWNGGMFFTRAGHLLAEIDRLLPATGAGLREIAAALRQGDDAAARATAAVYPQLGAISIDHGVMERTREVVAVPGQFGWSDVGSWQAIAGLRAGDGHGNAALGEQVVVDGAGNLTMTDVGVIAIVGVSGLAVVRDGDAVLVIPLERAQDTRAVVTALASTGRERYL